MFVNQSHIPSIYSLVTLPSTKGEEVVKIAAGALKGATVSWYILLTNPLVQRNSWIDCVAIGIGTTILERLIFKITKYIQSIINPNLKEYENNFEILDNTIKQNKIFQKNVIGSALILVGINFTLMSLCIFAIENVKFFNKGRNLSELKRLDISCVLFCGGFILNTLQIMKKIDGYCLPQTKTEIKKSINPPSPTLPQRPSLTFLTLTTEKISQITARLKKQFANQQHVIEHTLDAVAYGIINHKFVPTIYYKTYKGNGTTSIIRALAAELFGDEKRILKVDAQKWSKRVLKIDKSLLPCILGRTKCDMEAKGFQNGGIFVLKNPSHNRDFSKIFHELIDSNPQIIFIVHEEKRKSSNEMHTFTYNDYFYDLYHNDSYRRLFLLSSNQSQGHVDYLKEHSPVIHFNPSRVLYKGSNKHKKPDASDSQGLSYP